VVHIRVDAKGVQPSDGQWDVLCRGWSQFNFETLHQKKHFYLRVTKIELVDARLRALLYDRMFSRKWRPDVVCSMSKELCAD
jgi:hypothetical protein